MKALILATDIFTRGGIARYTYTFASALADLLGPESVDLLALLAYGDPSDLRPRFRVLGPVSDRSTPGAKVRFAVKALALAGNKYDLIVCSHLSLAPVAAVMRFVSGTPFWVVCHGSEVWGPLPLLKRLAFRRSSLLLPISRFTAEKLLGVHKIPRERVSILHNAIPDGFERLLAAPLRTGASEASVCDGERILLSVGSLQRSLAYKGFDTVIRALPAALKRLPNIKYVIVGEGDDRTRLEKLAAELQLESRVTFAGSVSDEQLAGYYRACDLFVLPSKATTKNGSWEGEGFGRAYVEAALAGKAVIGSSGGGAAEAALDGKTGLLVEPSSTEQIACAIIQLLENPARAAEMGRAGRKWAMENFTQEVLRSRLAELLQLDLGADVCPS
jgi:glycosyltransferase involved in cell wall biosynthesis